MYKQRILLKSCAEITGKDTCETCDYMKQNHFDTQERIIAFRKKDDVEKAIKHDFDSGKAVRLIGSIYFE